MLQNLVIDDHTKYGEDNTNSGFELILLISLFLGFRQQWQM